MATPGLNLPDLIVTVRKHKILILIISFVSAAAAAVFYLAGPRKYEGRTEFLIRNPLFGDRANLYNSDQKIFDYFADEDDVNRILLLAESDIVRSQVIRNMRLDYIYKVDGATRKGQLTAERKYNKSLNVVRTEYKDVVLTFVDTDPERAAAVANEIVRVVDEVYSGYYKETRKLMYESIGDKTREEDSSIAALTDTLTSLRNRYGIYDIISPARNNLMLSSMKSNGQKDFARGVEEIQNVESMKDQLVYDRAKNKTLQNQYSTGSKLDQMHVITVVTPAKNPVNAKGIGGMLTVLVGGFLGLFFSTMLLSLSDHYFSKLKIKD
jgi:uncharacterized protein involved in exopolysaccharide biosynthesis